MTTGTLSEDPGHHGCQSTKVRAAAVVCSFQQPGLEIGSSCNRDLYCCNRSYRDQTQVGEDARFVLELEFIQCLANPHYLNCECVGTGSLPLSLSVTHAEKQWAGKQQARSNQLTRCSCPLTHWALHLCAGLAQNDYLKDKAFLNYLQYLEYWRRPEYAKYIR